LLFAVLQVFNHREEASRDGCGDHAELQLCNLKIGFLAHRMAGNCPPKSGGQEIRVEIRPLGRIDLSKRRLGVTLKMG
jgi:hypothetical protein